MLKFDFLSVSKLPPHHSIEITHTLRQPDDITCGPTCMSMLLDFYGLGVSVDEAKRMTRTVWYSFGDRDIVMTAPALIVRAIGSLGLIPRLGQGSLVELKKTISVGRPCIVLVRSGEWAWHYVLVCGYDEEYVFFANPSSGEVEGLAAADFCAAWAWNSDLRGRDCGSLPRLFLKGIEIYPYSYIYVEK